MENQKTASKTSTLIVNAIIAALYVVLTLVIAPLSQGAIQLRISESLNHLVVFNKKLLWGVLAGVVMFNLFFSQGGLMDVLFGGGQTLIALSITAWSAKYVKSAKIRLAINTLVFSISMVLIAIMICMLSGFAVGSHFFWVTYGTLFLSEFIMMAISAPVMYYINKSVHFNRF